MNSAAVMALILAGVAAAADWTAVQWRRRWLEYACKPGTMLLLVAAALLLHPVSGSERTWFVMALCLGLVGDVFLMIPGDRFLPGLLSFLLGHLAFVAGFLVGGFSPVRGGVAAAGVAVLVALLLPRVTGGARDQGNGAMVPALAAYVVVIGLMVASAVASRQPLAGVPAALFFLSDTLIAFRRFVEPRPWMPVAIIVTYHLAQAGMVLWLAL